MPAQQLPKWPTSVLPKFNNSMIPHHFYSKMNLLPQITGTDRYATNYWHKYPPTIPGSNQFDLGKPLSTWTPPTPCTTSSCHGVQSQHLRQHLGTLGALHATQVALAKGRGGLVPGDGMLLVGSEK